MLTFAIAVFLLLITPGPGVLSTAGVGTAYGMRSGTSYVVGLFLGSNLVGVLVISGLAAIILDIPAIRIALAVLSAGYLSYLAAKIAFSGARIAIINPTKSPAIFAGIMLQLINPKAYAVNTTFFSGFAFYPDSFLTETIIKLLILNAIWIPVHIAWLYAGSRLRRLDVSSTAQRRINMVMAVCLLGVVVLSLVSILGY
ncbi:LysE family translocator [Candidatus Puniceispirillum sp.]|uniref:LysE family translocator n=1 Tax=Candidatus Puniceispirillum sp. TaxID=2026719 RepID=UPI001ED0BAAC|nr:LysE family translocator [Candidatus Puniceispirillum sp.]MBT6565471.1 LysE family translocator [Candidatus Puniceispirillum sp.]